MLIRQPDLIRAGEKSGIKFLNTVNKIGLLKSQKPLNVKDLALKMVNFARLKNQYGVNVYNQRLIEIIESKINHINNIFTLLNFYSQDTSLAKKSIFKKSNFEFNLIHNTASLFKPYFLELFIQVLTQHLATN